MWINPKYRDQVQQPAPPEDRGQRLATIPRGPDAEFRISLAEYEGRPYVSLRTWTKDRSSGEWWPKRGSGGSVRLSEVSTVIDALKSAVAAAGEPDRQQNRVRPGADEVVRGYGGGSAGETAYVPKGRPGREPFDPGKLRGAEPRQGFDETA